MTINLENGHTLLWPFCFFHLDKQRNILYNEENDYVTFTGGRYE